MNLLLLSVGAVMLCVGTEAALEFDDQVYYVESNGAYDHNVLVYYFFQEFLPLQMPAAQSVDRI